MQLLSTITPTPKSADMLALLLARRSVKPIAMAAPGPNDAELAQILTAAARVPDHKKLTPWRFIVFAGDARRQFGEVLASACLAEDAQTPSPVRLETERTRFLRAPLVVGVVSRFVETPGAPRWEQELSGGAACMNLCLAANALGFGTCWLTEWYSYSPRVAQALSLAGNERMAGFVYIGTATERQPDRDRPVLASIVSHWHG
jgi:nitroreductase